MAIAAQGQCVEPIELLSATEIEAIKLFLTSHSIMTPHICNGASPRQLRKQRITLRHNLDLGGHQQVFAPLSAISHFILEDSWPFCHTAGMEDMTWADTGNKS